MPAKYYGKTRLRVNSLKFRPALVHKVLLFWIDLQVSVRCVQIAVNLYKKRKWYMSEYNIMINIWGTGK